MRRHQRRSQENHKYKTQVRHKLVWFKKRVSRMQLECAEAAAGGTWNQIPSQGDGGSLENREGMADGSFTLGIE